MKILHITNAFSEGGVETLLIDVLSRMVAMGHQIDLLVLSKNQLVLRDDIEKKGVRVIAGKYNKVYNPLNIFEIGKYVGKYDVIHANLFPTQYYTIFAKCLYGIKNSIFITTEHSTFNNRRKYSLFKVLDRLVYKQYNAIISISEATTKSLYQWCKADSTVVYNGIDLCRFELTDDKVIARSSLDLDDNDIVLIMVGRFGEAKDQLTIIKSLAHLPEHVKLILVGSGETMDNCKEQAIAYGVEQRIIYTGNVKSPEHYLAISNVGILSSHWDGFGISAIEYMAMGLPTIVSDVEGLSEVVADGAVKVKPQSVEDMAEAIMRLTQDRAFYELMKQKGKERVAIFDINKTTASYVELYESLTLHKKRV